MNKRQRKKQKTMKINRLLKVSRKAVIKAKRNYEPTDVIELEMDTLTMSQLDALIMLVEGYWDVEQDFIITTADGTQVRAYRT